MTEWTKDFATDCTEDLKAKLKVIDGTPFRDAVLVVYNEADLKARTSNVKTPYLGVIYGGLQGVGDQAGVMADIVVAVLYALSNQQSDAGLAWRLLSAGRKAIRGTLSPTGHRWRFGSEVVVGERKEEIFYLQTWRAKAPITGEA